MGESLKPGWRWVRLGEVAVERTERVENPGASDFDRYVGSDDIDRFDWSVRRWRPAAEVTSAAKVFHPGDNLFVRRSLYASDFRERAARADFSGVCSGDILPLRERPGGIEAGFLGAVLNQPRIWDYVVKHATGSITRRIKWRDLAEYEFALPPLEEQRRIARVLDALRVTQQRHADTRLAADSALTATRSSFFEAFLKTYELVTLEDVACGRYGMVDGPFGSNLKSVHFRESGHPVISSSMFSGGTFAPSPSDYKYVDDEKFEQLARNRVVGGDILVVLIGFNCGTVAALPEIHLPGVITQNCLKITVNKAIARRDFVIEALRWLKESGRTERLVTTTQQRALSLGRLRRAMIPLPPVDTQDSFLDTMRNLEWAREASSTRERQLRSMWAEGIDFGVGR
jgi:type I restriction enzyme S subunit